MSTLVSMDIEKAKDNILPSITEKYYLNVNYADFHFIFERKEADVFERIPAHKMLLAESDVFQTMFNGAWKEKNEMVITNVSAAVFKEFLKCFYLLRMNLTMENVGFVMDLGNMYNVPRCLTACSKFLTNSITDDNVCTAYGLATLYDQEQLRRYCEFFIRTNTKAVLSSNGFLECDRKTLKYILDLDHISCSEANVFEGCMNWVKFKSGEDHLTREIVEEQFGELFKEFRFKSISQPEFAVLLPFYGKLFSVEEHIDIHQLFAVDEFKTDLFNTKQRKSIKDFEHGGIAVECNRLISIWPSCKPYQIRKFEVTTFSVDEPVLLERIEFAKLYKYENGDYNILTERLTTELEIVRVSEKFDGEILHKQKTLFEIEERTVIRFSKPILIRPNVMYEIRLKQSPHINYVTGTLFKSEVQMDSNITVKFHRGATVERCHIARGLVLHLGFKTI